MRRERDKNKYVFKDKKVEIDRESRNETKIDEIKRQINRWMDTNVYTDK